MTRILAAAALLLLGGCITRVPVACFRDGTLPGCPTVLAPEAKPVPVPVPVPVPQTAIPKPP